MGISTSTDSSPAPARGLTPWWAHSSKSWASAGLFLKATVFVIWLFCPPPGFPVCHLSLPFWETKSLENRKHLSWDKYQGCWCLFPTGWCWRFQRHKKPKTLHICKLFTFRKIEARYLKNQEACIYNGVDRVNAKRENMKWGVFPKPQFWLTQEPQFWHTQELLPFWHTHRSLTKRNSCLCQ